LAQPAQPFGSRTYIWGPLAATLLLVIGGGLLFPRLLQRSRATDYVEAAVAVHRSFLDGSLPLEVQSDSPGAATAWFSGKVPFHFRLPGSVETPGQEPVYKLVGGRLVTYKGGYAALVAYQMQREKISLLVAPSQSAAASEEKRFVPAESSFITTSEPPSTLLPGVLTVLPMH
jgi:hypothetical protein